MPPRKDFWKRVVRKPPHVIAYRGWQEARIRALGLTGGWERLARGAGVFWRRDRVLRLLGGECPNVFVHPTGGDALRRELDRDPAWAPTLTAFAEGIRRRRFSVLGAPVPPEGPWPWHADWRWGKTWDQGFFRAYDPYEARTVPFDVKMPWELSRMTFVPPLLQAWVITGDRSFRDDAEGILTDWERENPLAHSVNWHPMEASMRAIGFVILLGMLRNGPGGDIGLATVLARLATTHGEFIARTIEYTDVRGNHYMANVVALLGLGLSLGQVYPRARRWTQFGVRTLPRECMLQFHPDGVDFEGSVPYHRFVTELGVLGMLAMERGGYAGNAGMRRRLQLACRYAAACRRPDGLLPNVGDNDSACALPWDPEPPRDPSALLGVGAVAFEDGTLKPAAASHPPASVAWTLGDPGMRRWHELAVRTEPVAAARFPDGGVVVAKRGGHYLWVDLGGVGLEGRGGHGHNDLGSFELAIDGVPIVIDAGSPVYSGDPSLRNAFRSTAAHNTVQVDGEEIARLDGLWGIRDEARPTGVVFEETSERIKVAYGHQGYRRLSDPVDVTRGITFSFADSRLECVDTIRARGHHVVERFLHLDPCIRASHSDGAVFLEGQGRRWSLTWSPACDVEVIPGRCSPEYGVLEESTVILLRHAGAGERELRFAIAPLARSC